MLLVDAVNSLPLSYVFKVVNTGQTFFENLKTALQNINSNLVVDTDSENSSYYVLYHKNNPNFQIVLTGGSYSWAFLSIIKVRYSNNTTYTPSWSYAVTGAKAVVLGDNYLLFSTSLNGFVFTTDGKIVNVVDNFEYDRHNLRILCLNDNKQSHERGHSIALTYAPAFVRPHLYNVYVGAGNNKYDFPLPEQMPFLSGFIKDNTSRTFNASLKEIPFADIFVQTGQTSSFISTAYTSETPAILTLYKANKNGFEGEL